MVNSYGFSGGALYINDSESVSINSSYFRNNVAVLGNNSRGAGAICVYQGDVMISNGYFIDNNIIITHSNYGGSSMYVREGDMTVFNNTFCNKIPESNYTIHISSGNISISDNRFIIKDTAGNGYHLNIDGILCYNSVTPFNVIRIISSANNSFSDSTAANSCEFPVPATTEHIPYASTTEGRVTTNTPFVGTSAITITLPPTTTDTTIISPIIPYSPTATDTSTIAIIFAGVSFGIVCCMALCMCVCLLLYCCSGHKEHNHAFDNNYPT